MKYPIILASLLLSACAESLPMGDEPASLETANATSINPGRQLVRIGEGGPSFDACGETGKVLRATPVHAAPFAEADIVDRLPVEALLSACTRSIDQDWLGIVYAPPAQPDLECGVTAPVARERSYDGPCRSGWVAGNAVRLIAG